VDHLEKMIFEQIQTPDGKPAYAYSDGEPHKTGYTELPETPWLCAEASDTCRFRDDADLHSALVGFYQSFIYFRNETDYHVLASWTLATWIRENLRVYGPLYLLGPINSGKTTVLECLEETAYRGVRAGSASTAIMFRLDEKYHPTFLMDEAQTLNVEEKGEQQAMVNERYRRGGKVWRMVGDGASMTEKAFHLEGFSAFASDHEPWPALVSRALKIHMDKKPKDEHLEQTLTPTFHQLGQELRTNLLQYRFRHIKLGTENWDGEEVGPDPIEELMENAGIEDSRTHEVGYALLLTSPAESRTRILPWLKDLEKENQSEENTSHLADYVLALCKCQPENGKVSFEAVRVQIAIQQDNYDLLKGVIRNPKSCPSARSVGSNLKTLGFRKDRMTGGARGIILDSERLKLLCLRYGLPEPSVTSVTSVTLSTRDSDANDGSDARIDNGAFLRGERE
jgi:hypothetical protein